MSGREITSSTKEEEKDVNTDDLPSAIRAFSVSFCEATSKSSIEDAVTTNVSSGTRALSSSLTTSNDNPIGQIGTDDDYLPSAIQTLSISFQESATEELLFRTEEAPSSQSENRTILESSSAQPQVTMAIIRSSSTMNSKKWDEDQVLNRALSGADEIIFDDKNDSEAGEILITDEDEGNEMNLEYDSTLRSSGQDKCDDMKLGIEAPSMSISTEEAKPPPSEDSESDDELLIAKQMAMAIMANPDLSQNELFELQEKPVKKESNSELAVITQVPGNNKDPKSKAANISSSKNQISTEARSSSQPSEGREWLFYTLQSDKQSPSLPMTSAKEDMQTMWPATGPIERRKCSNDDWRYWCKIKSDNSEKLQDLEEKINIPPINPESTPFQQHNDTKMNSVFERTPQMNPLTFDEKGQSLKLLLKMSESAADIIANSYFLTEVTANTDPAIAEQNRRIAEQKKTFRKKVAKQTERESKRKREVSKDEVKANQAAAIFITKSCSLTELAANLDPKIAEQNRQIVQQKEAYETQIVVEEEEKDKTPEQLVVESWERIKVIPDYQQIAGKLLFRRIFEINPDAAELFQFAQGYSAGDDEMYRKMLFEKHSTEVISTVTAAVSLLKQKDMETLVSMLKEFCGRHVDIDLQQSHYNLVGEALIYTLGEALSEYFTSKVKDAWVGVYGIITEQMMAGEKEMSERKTEEEEETEEKRQAAAFVTSSYNLTEMAANADPKIAEQNRAIADQKKAFQEKLSAKAERKSKRDREPSEEETRASQAADSIITKSYIFTETAANLDTKIAEQNRQIVEQKMDFEALDEKKGLVVLKDVGTLSHSEHGVVSLKVEVGDVFALTKELGKGRGFEEGSLPSEQMVAPLKEAEGETQIVGEGEIQVISDIGLALPREDDTDNDEVDLAKQIILEIVENPSLTEAELRDVQRKKLVPNEALIVNKNADAEIYFSSKSEQVSFQATSPEISSTESEIVKTKKLLKSLKLRPITKKEMKKALPSDWVHHDSPLKRRAVTVDEKVKRERVYQEEAQSLIEQDETRRKANLELESTDAWNFENVLLGVVEFTANILVGAIELAIHAFLICQRRRR